MKFSEKVVAVTGASGFIGSHVCKNLVEHGYRVRACVRDTRPSKTAHLLALNSNNDSNIGTLELCTADMMVEGAYDEIFQGCFAVFHVAGNFGTDKRWQEQTEAMGRPPPIDQALSEANEAQTPSPVKSYDQGVYESYVLPMKNILKSIQRSCTVQRLIYTSSACAGPLISENEKVYETVEENAYGKGKVDCERLIYQFGQEHPNILCMSSCPDVVMGPLLASPVHDTVFQHRLGDMLAKRYLLDGDWWITDVRDVAETQRLMVEQATSASSSFLKNGSRFWNGSARPWSTRKVLAMAAQRYPQFADAVPPRRSEEEDEEEEASGNGEDVDSTVSDGDSYGESEWDEHRRTVWSDPVEELGLVRRHVKETIQDTVQSLVELGVLDRPISNHELRDYFNVAVMDGCDEECEYILAELKRRKD